MGFDCTLHVVDEGSVLRFVDRFLGRSKEKAPYDRKFKGAAAAFSAVTKAIETNPGQGARELAALLLRYCSAETPHVYSRGFALSLWDEATLGTKLPTSALSSPEPLLREVVAAYPVIAGKIPQGFDGNWSLGYFVSAKDVPALLAHVEATFDAMAPGERIPYLGLRTVLRVAAKRGMAYWEATDLEVAQANEKWLAEEAPKPLDDVRLAKLDFGGALTRPQAISGDRLVFGDLDSYATHVVDVGEFPPRRETMAGFFTTDADFAAHGRLVCKATTTPRSERPRVFGLYEVDRFDAPPRKLEVQLPWDVGGFRALGEDLYVFPRDHALGRRGDTLNEVRPVIVREGRATTPDVPPAKGKPSSLPSSYSLDCGAFPFGDGSFLVVWDGEAYRYERGAIAALGIDDLDPESDIASSQAGFGLDDGVLLLSHRKLLHVRANGEAKKLLPSVENVMYLVALPHGAVLMKQGDNLENDAFKIWWRESNELTRVPPSAFGLEETPNYVMCARALDALIVGVGKDLRLIPLATLAAMPRLSEDDFAAAHAKLKAKKRK